VREIEKITKENKFRYGKFFGYYNTVFGINSEIPRLPFKVYKSQASETLIPEAMIKYKQVKNLISEFLGCSQGI
tara:strand:- start:2811 stop:3032 length:222 start_codon:yes stop_codon:yes gene_type:complete